jgi:hypothetical protein
VRYALPNEWQLARERLDMLQAAHDQASIRRASALGVGPGIRCLEAGAGGGSFARWLASRGCDVVAADMRGAYRDAWLAFYEHMQRAGVDAEWARGLPARLGELGLTGVGAEIDGQIFSGGSPAARMWAMTWLQALPSETEAGRTQLEDPATWFHGPAKVVAWRRRPTG